MDFQILHPPRDKRREREGMEGRTIKRKKGRESRERGKRKGQNPKRGREARKRRKGKGTERGGGK